MPTRHLRTAKCRRQETQKEENRNPKTYETGNQKCSSWKNSRERWFDLRGAADTNLYQISHSLSVQPQKERDDRFSFPHEKRLCMWGTLLRGVTSCGHSTILAGHVCHTPDLGYLNLTKSPGLPILLREREAETRQILVTYLKARFCCTGLCFVVCLDFEVFL